MKATVLGICFIAAVLLITTAEANNRYNQIILNNIEEYIWSPQGGPPRDILKHNVGRTEVLVYTTKGAVSPITKCVTLYWYEALLRGTQEVEVRLELNSVNKDGTRNEAQIYGYEECDCGTITQKETGIKSACMFQWNCGITGAFSYYEDGRDSYYGCLSIDFELFQDHNYDDLCQAIYLFQYSGLKLQLDRPLSTGEHHFDFNYVNCQDGVYVEHRGHSQEDDSDDSGNDDSSCSSSDSSSGSDDDDDDDDD